MKLDSGNYRTVSAIFTIQIDIKLTNLHIISGARVPAPGQRECQHPAGVLLSRVRLGRHLQRDRGRRQQQILQGIFKKRYPLFKVVEIQPYSI